MQVRHSRDEKVNKSLNHSIKDGVAYSLMSGSGESYFSAFALFFKATTAQIGVLASLPPLLASFAQLFSAWLGRRGISRKPLILFGATIQGIMLIPFALLPLFFPDHATAIMIICATLYFAGSHLAAPQWASLMGDLVPERRRGRFFGRRTRLCSIAGFVALIGAGIVLDLFDRNSYTLTGYLVIFLFAAGARFISVYHLAQMVNPSGHIAALESPFKPGMIKRIQGSPFARFSFFFAMMQFSVAIASPFFSVYMLRDLHFSYLEYTISSAASVMMQFIALNRWGRLGDVFGNRLILGITGLMIPCLPLFWLLSSNYLYILLVQAFGGLAWAGFSLSASNYIYDLVPAEKRVTFMSLHSVLTGLAVFSGALIGGFLGSHLPNELVLFGDSYHWLSALYGVFLLSAIARFTVVLKFLPHIKEVREVKTLVVSGLIFRVTRFHPVSGLIFDIVGAKRQPDQTPRL